jgi:nucleoside-diphosphate-sugar epimerase
MSKSFDFITGATGFVGSALVLDLLSRTDRTLVCLVRAEDSLGAYERLQSALHEAALSHGCEKLIPEIFSRCVAVAGDLLDPGFGADTSHLGRVCDFWHCAASLEFDESRKSAIFENNLEGTRNALEVARGLGAERFFHVSTAYVCGKRLGDIPEEAPSLALGFHNPYEESKAQTELMLLDEREMDVWIIRPSIVIGNSHTFASNSTTGVYGFMREIYRAQRSFERQKIKMPALRISGAEDSILAVVPVDVFARDAVSIALSSTTDRIFHVTRRNSITAMQNLQLMCTLLGIPRPELAAPGEPLDRFNQMLVGKLGFYRPYLSGNKEFSTANTEKVTGPPEARVVDPLPYSRWYRDYLVANDVPGAALGQNRSRVA